MNPFARSSADAAAVLAQVSERMMAEYASSKQVRNTLVCQALGLDRQGRPLNAPQRPAPTGQAAQATSTGSVGQRAAQRPQQPATGSAAAVASAPRPAARPTARPAARRPYARVAEPPKPRARAEQAIVQTKPGVVQLQTDPWAKTFNQMHGLVDDTPPLPPKGSRTVTSEVNGCVQSETDDWARTREIVARLDRGETYIPLTD